MPSARSPTVVAMPSRTPSRRFTSFESSPIRRFCLEFRRRRGFSAASFFSSFESFRRAEATSPSAWFRPCRDMASAPERLATSCCTPGPESTFTGVCWAPCPPVSVESMLRRSCSNLAFARVFSSWRVSTWRTFSLFLVPPALETLFSRPWTEPTSCSSSLAWAAIFSRSWWDSRRLEVVSSWSVASARLCSSSKASRCRVHSYCL
mmetsp:Transcript_4155/g.12259  ORF Transcript_4155/g.12259 Transcript_4155/m.12259 type:complete len:206 (+) Transcript_4155:466-1083(+)